MQINTFLRERYTIAVACACLLASIARPAAAQDQFTVTCPSMIQQHIEWLKKGIVTVNGAHAYTAAVFGTMTSHSEPSANLSSTPDSAEYAVSHTTVDSSGNLVFDGVIASEPISGTLNLTARVTITPVGLVTIRRLLNGKPFTLQGDTFTATCVGNFADRVRGKETIYDRTTGHDRD